MLAAAAPRATVNSMFGKLFLLFTIVPAIELYLLIQIGERMGAGATLALVLLTGVLGAALARREGLRVLRVWQNALAQGRVPEEGVVSGLLVLVGGVLLITPGLLTDVAGLLLLVPAVRRVVAAVLSSRIEAAISSGTIRVVRGASFEHEVFATDGAFRARRWSTKGDGYGVAPDVIDTDGESVPSQSGRLH